MKIKITANQAGEMRDAMRVQCEDGTEYAPIARTLADRLKAGTMELDGSELELMRREANSRMELWYDRKCVEGRQSAGMYRSMAKLVENLK